MAADQTPATLVPGAFAIKGFPLVEFDRKSVDPMLLTGFVLGWSSELTLLHLLNDSLFRLNGYAVIRNIDVASWRPIPQEDFLARASRVHRLRASRPPEVLIDSMKDAVESAGAAFPLLTIHRERIKRGVCHVGRVVGTTQRAVKLLEITSQAEWDEESTYLLRDITLLEFGGAYETLLIRLADAP